MDNETESTKQEINNSQQKADQDELIVKNEKGKTPWHPLFLAALKLDLMQYKNILEYYNELQLNKEPSIMDVLVVKKLSDVTIEKEIARIFRTYNVIEYKSPKDYVSIDDYYKVKMYCYQYKIIADKNNKTPDIDEITMTLISNYKPEKLLKHLEERYGRKTKKYRDGIYYVEGDEIPVQIIIPKKLSPKDSIFLKLLVDKIETEEEKQAFREAIDNFNKKVVSEEYFILLPTIATKNIEIFLEVSKMYDTLLAENREKFKKFVEGTTLGNDLIKYGKIEMVKEMLKIGLPIYQIVQCSKLPENIILKIQEELNDQLACTH